MRNCSLAALLLLLGTVASLSQEALSKTSNELALNATFGKGAIMCGPYLWALVGDPENFKGATPVSLIVGGTAMQGRGITKDDQKRLLWSRLKTKLVATGRPVVRNPNSAEISFYWAMIPFDIEEPLLVAELGKERLLVNFAVKEGKPRFFWLDIVGDLKTPK